MQITPYGSRVYEIESIFDGSCILKNTEMVQVWFCLDEGPTETGKHLRVKSEPFDSFSLLKQLSFNQKSQCISTSNKKQCMLISQSE